MIEFNHSDTLACSFASISQTVPQKLYSLPNIRFTSEHKYFLKRVNGSLIYQVHISLCWPSAREHLPVGAYKVSFPMSR